MNQAAAWVLMGMFVGILNKVEYCSSITESPSALSALLCLCFVWSRRCHSASWSYDHHCCMVHLDYCDVILISLLLIFFLSHFPTIFLSFICLYVYFLLLWSTQEVVPFLFVHMQIIHVCFSWYYKCKQALSSNLFTSEMWLFQVLNFILGVY